MGFTRIESRDIEIFSGYMKSRFMFSHAQSVVGMVAPDHPIVLYKPFPKSGRNP